MKSSLLFTGSLLLALISGSTQAQVSSSTVLSRILKDRDMSFAERAHIQVTPAFQKSTAKTTRTASRLIAESSYKTDGVNFYLNDTGHYVYSGDRGGEPGNDMKFDNYQRWYLDALSGTLMNNTKVVQSFDGSNRMLSQITQLWNASTASWLNMQQVTYAYDAAGNITTQSFLNWNTGSAIWENSTRYNYAYDGMGNVTAANQQSWSISASDWINYSNMLYTYAPGTKLQTSYIYQVWDMSSSTWLNYVKYVTAYNTKGNRTSLLSQHYVTGSGTWADDYKVSYEYDVTGTLLVMEASQSWDVTTAAWLNNNKYLYSYDGAGLATSMVYQYWSTPATAWINGNRQTFTYDAAGNNNSMTMQLWNDLSKTWDNNNSTLMDYDVMRNNTLQIETYWNSVRMKWDSGARTQTTYNTNSQPTAVVTDEWNDGGFWEYALHDTKRYYYYEEYTTGISETANRGGTAKLFPVPADQELQLELNWKELQAFTVTICDVQGRVWQQWQMPAATSYQERISVKELPAGNYIMQFKGMQNGQITQQITVAH